MRTNSPPALGIAGLTSCVWPVSRQPAPHAAAEQVDRAADVFRLLLQNALTVHSTLATQQQNDEMRRLSQASLAQNEEAMRISAWAAILFAPALTRCFVVAGTVTGCTT